MSRFLSNKTQKIDLGEGESVEVKSALSFAEMQPIVTELDQENVMENIKVALPLLELAIVGWSLKGDDGAPVEFSKEKIKDLDTNTVIELVQIMVNLYFPEKKNSEPSDE